MNASKGALCRACSVGLLLSATVYWADPASAGVITGVTLFGANAGTGPGLGTVAVPVIVTTAPNNDNVPAAGVPDNNIVVPIKRFDFNGIIDIEFHVAPSSGVTEYQSFESVDNNTGVNWSGYRTELGFGVGAAFVKSAPGDGLDFDFPNYDLPPVSSAFALVGTPDEDTLAFSSGLQGGGAQTYQFRIDVPDMLTANAAVFTLRQVPIPVPEPSTMTLLSVALAGFVARRSRR